MKKLIRRLVRRNPMKRRQLTFEKIKANDTFEGLKWVCSFGFFEGLTEWCVFRKIF